METGPLKTPLRALNEVFSVSGIMRKDIYDIQATKSVVCFHGNSCKLITLTKGQKADMAKGRLWAGGPEEPPVERQLPSFRKMHWKKTRTRTTEENTGGCPYHQRHTDIIFAFLQH